MIAVAFRVFVAVLLIFFLVLLLILASQHSLREQFHGGSSDWSNWASLLSPSSSLSPWLTVTGETTPPLICHTMVSFGAGTLIAFKLTTFFLAVHQLVVVVRSLRYYGVMGDWPSRMVGMTWGCVVFWGVFGTAGFFLGFKNAVEFHRRPFGVKRVIMRLKVHFLSSTCYKYILPIKIECFSFETTQI